MTSYLPIQDLQAASLAGVPTLPTEFHIDATDQGRTVTLIGAYADPARTVLFFRGTTGIRLLSVRVDDDAGMINAGGSDGRHPAPGDTITILDGGPTTLTGGVAHLRITIQDIESWPPKEPQHVISGAWSYAISLKVQPSTVIAPPPPFALGRWKESIELLEITPSVIRLQAVINGGSNVEVMGPGIPAAATLVDQSGAEIPSISAGAGISVPKDQVNAVTYRNTRIRYQWPRPSEAQTLQLRFQGAGGTYTIPVVIPALAAAG